MGKLVDIGCADCSESEKGLEDESTTDGERIVAAVVAALVEAVEFLEPTGGGGARDRGFRKCSRARWSRSNLRGEGEVERDRIGENGAEGERGRG